MPTNRLRTLYERLLAAHGPQGWWPADGPLEVIVGAILTQRTAWRNVERATDRLRGAELLSIEAIDRAAADRISEAIRPVGFRVGKARKLKEIASHLKNRYGGDLDRLFARPTEELREELLGLFGIGEETADAILVYAARRPSFVVDAYARRLLTRLGWIEGREAYQELRKAFLDALPDDVALLGEYHALIVRHGQEYCRAAPVCDGCPVRAICAEGQSARAPEVSR